jgi:8-oxo-dGTP diphosphatase
MVNQIVVAGAIIAARKVLVAQRIRPPALTGRWELPGGKVATGESDCDALARELAEELGIDVTVGSRLGDDVELNATTTLRAYLVGVIRGEPQPHDHAALRWVGVGELNDVDWVPADRAFLPALRQALEEPAEVGEEGGPVGV